MPLRRITKFCSAICRARNEPCKNPAAYGMPVCRSHGAHKIVATGTDHGRYKTGQCTQKAKAAYKAAAKRLADLEDAARGLGMITGPKSRGRKPK